MLFSQHKENYEKQKWNLLSFDDEALLWLKIKSLMRLDIVKDFLVQSGINLSSSKLDDIFKELYAFLVKKENATYHIFLDNYLVKSSAQQYSSLDVEHYISELYKLQYFEWGGDYQNSLDKYLVKRFIKDKFYSFSEIKDFCSKEIKTTVEHYVLNSWYNHWTSILIEHVFKKHPAVTPVIGQIKGVDFFVDGFPFDLKVTYFPVEYMKLQRKLRGLKPELTFLKSEARKLKIQFDAHANDSLSLYEISERMKDMNCEKADAVLKQIQEERHIILNETQENPDNLIKWLYENQGEMRFGAENRIFVILIDSKNYSDSWKLKRNLDILKPAINLFLDCFKKENIKEHEVKFVYKNTKYITYSDIIFVIK